MQRLQQREGTVLPPEMRPKLISTVDRPFAGVLAVFLAVELTGAVALAQRRVVVGPWEELPTVADHFPAPLALPPPRRATLLPTSTRAAGSPHRAPSAAATTRPGPVHDLREMLRHTGALAILAARADDLSHAVDAAIGPTAVAEEIAEAVRDAHGRLSLGDDGLRGPKDSGPTIADSDAVRTEGGDFQSAPSQAGRAAPSAPHLAFDPEVPPPGGDPDSSQVAAFVHAHLSQLGRCYEHELKLHPELHGRLVIRFLVSTSGEAEEATIEDDRLGSEGLERCLLGQIGRWRLPLRPAEEVPVSFPLVLTPSAG